LVYQLSGTRGRHGGVSSGDQLAKRIELIREHQAHIRPMADAQVEFERTSPDEAVEDVLDFLRQWPGHLFPRLVMILQAITEDVFGSYDLPTGDYRHYAATVEAHFRTPVLTTLEEYGLPAPLAARLLRFLPSAQTTDQLDEVLNELRRSPRIAGLSRFEEDMLRDTIDNL
jgi:hypothetical protein